jgi:hypothetical protein
MGYGCENCCMKCRPLVVEGVWTCIADERLSKNFSVALKAKTNGELRGHSRRWWNPAPAQARANLPY